jgi:hypothetical protein
MTPEIIFAFLAGLVTGPALLIAGVSLYYRWQDVRDEKKWRNEE